MNEPTWGSLIRRAWRVLVLRFTPLAPECEDCGMPIERESTNGPLWRTARWGDGSGRCRECSAARWRSATVQTYAERARDVVVHEPGTPIVAQSREIFMTGCYFGNSPPTTNLVAIVLIEGNVFFQH